MTDYEKIVEQIAKDICKENKICTCKEKRWSLYVNNYYC